eukprot:gnl/TRDRNA2_/TRDRNA2_42570_c0_seq1.p1 gnl/TRDRNA2_/TRDRNA2_42570_c0~~gnl/TRDRNA2_/TRDRNA2_42570_c0_seq1.p1  ORF type:complete len:437 (-),score=64.75 gnl/TRDRNA2_/TRDRNA2_42570_c0_seq1:21-1331(-)
MVSDASANLPVSFTRVWVGSPQGSTTARPLRVLSFNLLADGLAEGSLEGAPVAPAPPAPTCTSVAPSGVTYAVTSEACADEAPEPRRPSFRCPHAVLAWERRWPTLRALLLEHEPDLVGLQELDLAQELCHADSIARELEAMGYSCRTARKKGRACDGVGLLWRRSRLEAVSSDEVWRLSKGSVHVAIAQRLRLDGEGGPELLAVATHFKAGLTDEAEKIRLQQAEGMVKHIRSARVPALVLADLNSSCRPLLGEGALQLEPQVYPYLAKSGFRSVMKVVAGSEPSFTCWGGWRGYDVSSVFDYIMLFGKRLVPHQVLELPPCEEVLRFSERLPNSEYPSDHFAIVADVSLLPTEGAGDTAKVSDSYVGSAATSGGYSTPAAAAPPVAPQRDPVDEDAGAAGAPPAEAGANDAQSSEAGRPKLRDLIDNWAASKGL